ncbi:glycosyltransferase family 2 protein [Leclercia adecarboxylata]|uniref:glycosyltransferase family 2 protein n=1 Tax=Leclercia adecarboxylata TaxID=83655 RepID=UPI002DB976B8|nr:glycosyltransferase family 2 protein [Leclercia adecarboxylata]MEB6378348.1 glycosyltransferase family 2 protein [Leclercia adecarboxylata]
MTALGCVVVWYNPSKKELNNIKSYYSHVDRIYIVDNSDSDNSGLLNSPDFSAEKIVYHPNLTNIGIASALNRGCLSAIKDGFEWIMTMDQDSTFPEHEITKFLYEFEAKIKGYEDIAIVAPRSSDLQSHGFVEKVITSGNIVNLHAYQQVGGFDDELFIDEVDHDFCFKLIQANYKIFLLSNVRMAHSLGNSKIHNFIFNYKFHVMHHSPVRKYYIIRNRLIVRKRYPAYTRRYIKDNIHLLISIILFEGNKVEKIINAARGYRDYKKNKLGKIK